MWKGICEVIKKKNGQLRPYIVRCLSFLVSTFGIVESEVQQDAAYSERDLLECKFHKIGILFCFFFFHCPIPMLRGVPGTGRVITEYVLYKEKVISLRVY